MSTHRETRREPLIDTLSAALLLNTSPRTLERWRIEGAGPPYVKVGRRVRYDVVALQRWVDERTIGAAHPA